MSRDFSSAILTQIAADSKRPTHLYEITLTYLTLRFAAAKANILFPAVDGNVWTAKAIRHDAPGASTTGGGVGKSKILFADGAGEMLAYHKADNFKGKKIRVLRIYRDALDSADDRVEIFEGFVNNCAWDYEHFSVEVIAGDSLRQKLPRRAYTLRCPYSPGNAQCNANGLFDITTTPFLQTGQMTGALGSFTDVARTEADDYWKWGQVILKEGNNVYRRQVTAFAAGVFTLDVPTPIAAATVVDYTLTRGCDGSWAACSGAQAWGPIADNFLNHGGFIHITNLEME